MTDLLTTTRRPITPETTSALIAALHRPLVVPEAEARRIAAEEERAMVEERRASGAQHRGPRNDLTDKARRAKALELLQTTQLRYFEIAQQCSLDGERVRRMARQRGLCREPVSRPWKAPEIERLRDMLREGRRLGDIAQMLGRSRLSVERARERLGNGELG